MLYTYILLIPIYQRSSFEKKLIVMMSVDVSYQLYVNQFESVCFCESVARKRSGLEQSRTYIIVVDFQEIVANPKVRDIRGNDED